VAASLADGGFPFDVVVIGAGMYGGYCAEKLYRLSAGLGLRILVLDAGATLFATHYQNLLAHVRTPPCSRLRRVAWHLPVSAALSFCSLTGPGLCIRRTSR
jgi:choline dehydrogenase-like flavoprotein